MKNPFFKSVLSEDDFKSAMSTQSTFTESEPSNDEWTYVDVEQAAHINTASSREGFVALYLGKVYAGDTIELSAEFLNISGTKARLTVDWFSDEGYSQNKTADYISSANDNDYQKTSFTYTVMSDGYIRVLYGLWGMHTGEFKMRKLLCNVETIKSEDSKVGAWKNVTSLNNGWTINPNGSIRYKKDYLGYVTLEFYAYSGSVVAPKTTIFSLPSGFRPSQIVDFRLFDNADGNNLGHTFSILNTGEVRVSGVTEFVDARSYRGSITFYAG